jgi:hypothetical protein
MGRASPPECTAQALACSPTNVTRQATHRVCQFRQYPIHRSTPNMGYWQGRIPSLSLTRPSEAQPPDSCWAFFFERGIRSTQNPRVLPDLA